VFGAKSTKKVLVVLIVALGAGVFKYNIELGQSNALILAFIASAVIASAKQRYHLLSGFLWGLVLLFKPILAFLALCWWPKPRIILGAFISVLLLLGSTGFNYTYTYFTTLPSVVMLNYKLPLLNTSILGAISHFGTNSFSQYIPIAIAGLAITTYNILKLRDQNYQVALALSTAFCFFPIVEMHHLILALIPVLIFLHTAQENPGTGARLSIAFVIAALFLTPYFLVNELLYFLPVAGNITLWVTLLRHAPTVIKTQSASNSML